MSILSGFFKTKKYRKTDTGYQLQSEWTSASTVEMADGNTLETNLGDIKGITDSLTATSSNVALSAKGGNSLQGQIDTLNSNFNTLDTNFSDLDNRFFYGIASDNINSTENRLTSIGAGIVDNVCYINFNVHWIRLQLKITAENVFYRFSYGANGWSNWKDL